MTPNVILIVRLMITLTFFILVIFGPYAIIKLNRFIKVYRIRHEEVRLRIARIEKHLGFEDQSDDRQ